ncbi:ABC transporter permease (plasmid) [Rhizobium sp. CB3171]|uniref:ABC transporter permease n=1 Tax=unclassified Rhizobium TaxID=2613769 RepID=UPI0021A36148|nr:MULTISPECIES: ABC transporter permease [Rhizobium]UWU25507.1 ABC transporter permease [Rhizobium tropici]WFU06922.1 ABC transporter permease [Rhizobium sp. CB3171]
MRKAASLLPAAGTLLVALAAWQLTVIAFDIQPFVLPSPLSIAGFVGSQASELLGDLTITIGETLAGFAIGSAIGIGSAIVFVLAPPFQRAVMPLAVMINMVPTVAFVPLALIWFGVGVSSKIAIAALSVSFPVLVNTLAGLNSPLPAHIDLYRSFGARSLSVLARLRFPASLPSVATGLKVGFARSTVVVIVTEMLGAYSGIGQTIYRATSQIDSITVWSAVVLSSVASLILYGILAGLLKRFIWWD